jgi:heat shock protein HtpX
LLFQQVGANKRKSFLLILFFLLLFGGFGVAVDYLIGYGWVGIAIVLVIIAAWTLLSWYKSDRIALSVARARRIDHASAPRLFNLVEGLSIAAGIPVPAIYIIQDPAPNAFATGRNPQHAAVAVTTGLLEKMERVELEGVLAHELSHITNRDTLVSTLTVTLVGVIVLVSDVTLRLLFFGGGRRRDGERDGGGAAAIFMLIGVVFLVLAPVVAQLVQLAVSRRRESLADVSAVTLTRYPPGLISALEKLKADSTVVRAHSKAMAHLWIESPLDRDKSWLSRLFDTHPPLEERIRTLKEL